MAKVQLKNHRLSQRYVRQSVKTKRFGEIAKAKANVLKVQSVLTLRFRQVFTL
jgi:hypothetical protein